MDSSSTPPKVSLNTPLRRMNTHSKKKLSSLALLYTPPDQQQGYRRSSLTKTTSPVSDKSKQRISGINFGIPVVPDDEAVLISQPSSPRVVSSSERPTSTGSIPSPSPQLIRPLSLESPKTPVTPQFEVHVPEEAAKTPVAEDELTVSLRELAAKELELLEIKETIKNLTSKKRSMELEFENLKKTVERNLYKQMNPNLPPKKKLPTLSNPRFLKSPNRHQRTVSDQNPLDDNFQEIPSNTKAPSSNTPRHSQSSSRPNRRQSGLWGIITQVDNYIQNEFEKFNIIDLNPEQTRPTRHDESFVQISPDIPFQDPEFEENDNRIKNLLDQNQNSILPPSLRHVVDAVIYGNNDEKETPRTVEMKKFNAD